MLSTQAIKNTAQASHYFLEHDNYYKEEQTLGQERSQWWGKGAQALGLSGYVDTKTFTQLLRGTLPDGQQLGKPVGDKIHHRPGFDLTFSVPKSVSLAALLGGDDRVLNAVERATDKALQLIERDLVKARITRLGEVAYQKTGNLVVAKFLHDLSREGDPQLHTHCVVMNLTQRVDGKWRSLASQMGTYGESAKQTPEGFLEAVRHHKKYYGALFRAELAFELKQLGYGIEKGQQGFFEIAGISDDTIKAYSQRRKDIESFLQEHQFIGAKAAAVATLKTRPSKKQINRDTLMASWQAKAALFSASALEEIQQTVQQAHALFSHRPSENTLIDKAVSETTLLAAQLPSTYRLAEQAVKDAIAHLSETRIALREAEVVHQASRYITGDVSLSALLDTVETFKQTGELILLPQEASDRGEVHFTTSALLGYEKQLLARLEKLHPRLKSVTPEACLTHFLHNHLELTKDQQQALRTLFSSQRQLLMLEGASGSGKTHLLKPMLALAESGGYKPWVLTPGKAHSVHLSQQLKSVPTNLREWFQSLVEKKQCDTVTGFLYRTQGMSALEAKLQKKPFLIVEQAHTLSSKQMNDLVQTTEKLGGRLVLVGDAKAPLPWQAGSPFVQLLNNGITAANLTDNPHTIANPLKQAVQDTLQGHIQTAFEKISTRIFSIENKAERLEVMAAHYVGLSPKMREKTAVLMPTQKNCDEIQIVIREQLKQQGDIRPNETNLQVLLPHAMTAVQQKYAASYQVGQWVRFNADYVSLRVNKGDYRHIVGIDTEQNHIVLANAKGKMRVWNPSKIAMGKTTVFDVKERALAVGDTLVWRYTDKQRFDKLSDRYAGMKLQVLGIGERYLQLKLENGRVIRLDHRKPASQHWDYGYAFTPSRICPEKLDTIIAYQGSASRQSHQRSFYQLMGQAQQQAWLYTEDKTQLLKTLQQHTGDKMTVVDALLRQSVLETCLPKEVTASFSTHNQLLELAVQRQLDLIKQSATPEGMAQEAVRYALAHLSEREAAFTHKEVVKTALHYALGETSHRLIEHAVLAAEKSGALIRGVYSKDGTRWTTQEALQQEQAILNLAKANLGEFPGLFSPEAVNAYNQAQALSQEQGDTLGKLANLQDRVALIQGYAGTRKTTLLQHVQTLLQAQQQALLCLAPTHTAVKELKARGLEGQTLDHFLAQYRLGKMSAPTTPSNPSNPSTLSTSFVIAVDESSMVSNRRLQDFLMAIQQLGARAILMGDTKQYAAIESGKPFALLQQAGVQTLQLTDITRQQDHTLKQAVKATYAGDFKAAFRVLDSHIVEIGGAQAGGEKIQGRIQRLEAIRDDYLGRDADRRAQTLIVTFGNEERMLQNALIREKLQAQGELFGESFVQTVLVARNFSTIEQTRASNYTLGDVLRFNAPDSALGIANGQYWTVTKIDAQHNALVLARDNKTLLWKPSQCYEGGGLGVEVYQSSARDIQAGDLIRWTRTDKRLGLFSAELAKVMAASAQEITVRPIVLTDQGIKPSGHLIND